MPSSKQPMSVDNPNWYGDKSFPWATTPTPANKWAAPSTALLSSTTPLAHSFHELELLSNSSCKSTMSVTYSDVIVEESMNGSLDTWFEGYQEGCSTTTLSLSSSSDNDNQKRTIKKSSLELEVDLGAVKGVMGRSIIVKELDKEERPEISSSFHKNVAVQASLQQRKNVYKRHSMVAASSKEVLPEVCGRRRRVSCNGDARRRSFMKSEDGHDMIKSYSSSKLLPWFIERRQASYNGSNRSFIFRNQQENGSQSISSNPVEAAEVVEYTKDGITLLKEAMEEVILELNDTSEKLENLEAEQDSNQDILSNILNRTAELESSMIKISEEQPTRVTENSPNMSGNSFSLQATTTTQLGHQMSPQDGENMGGKASSTIYVTVDDMHDMMEKLSNSHKAEIDNIKHMIVNQREQLVDLEIENQEIKKCLREKQQQLYPSTMEADAKRITKKHHMDSCKCSIQ